MIFLVILVIFATVALFVVSAINRAQEKEQARRLQQRKLKIQVDALTDIVNCLEQTIPNHLIAKFINDESITLLQQILFLENTPSPHMEARIQHAIARSSELSLGTSSFQPSFQKESDAQITQTQVQLNEAGKVIRHLAALGKISNAELDLFMADLTWAYLMVSVASYVGQGYKFSAMQDRLSAQGFYQKAQNLLMESLNPDPRRLRMIKELSEILDGSRKTMSFD
jgi:hypothetical protein